MLDPGNIIDLKYILKKQAGESIILAYKLL